MIETILQLRPYSEKILDSGFGSLVARLTLALICYRLVTRQQQLIDFTRSLVNYRLCPVRLLYERVRNRGVVYTLRVADGAVQ
jgi:hypothetical protein